MENANPVIAVIGGSGLYDIEGISDVEELCVNTPFGEPSDNIVSGRLSGSRVLFLARHGRGHRLSPAEVNYRANIFALKSLGAEWCISVSAVGSLEDKVAPGDMVIPDQLIDRTTQRPSTFFEGGLVAHVSMAEPFCPVLRHALYLSANEVASRHGAKVHGGGIYICIEGPAFSTRAESNMYRSLGARVIGMTNLPEAKLAREAEMAYATLALVTDYDCWKQEAGDVDVATVIRRLETQAAEAKVIVAKTIEKLSSLSPSPIAAQALKKAFLTRFADADPKILEKLRPLIGRYINYTANALFLVVLQFLPGLFAA